MPRGDKSIKDKGKKFSSEYQPENRRQSTKFLTDLIVKNLGSEKQVTMEGICSCCKKKAKFKVANPTQDVIISALLRKAESGDISAIREILDRVEGKPVFTAEVNLPGVQHIGFDGE